MKCAWLLGGSPATGLISEKRVPLRAYMQASTTIAQLTLTAPFPAIMAAIVCKSSSLARKAVGRQGKKTLRVVSSDTSKHLRASSTRITKRSAYSPRSGRIRKKLSRI